ncbi:MAG: hypothetical protein H6739_09715 [Alphaproteobacteria bacterium]|nr:hypothetical protein [Alphaproteobacteria bacterium]
MRVLPLTLLLLLACTSTPEDPADALVAAWPEDPDGVAARVRALDDPVVQQVAVSRLAERYPGQTGALCAALEAGPARDRCARFNQRPHLWTVPPRAADAAPALRPAPPADVVVPDALLDIWAATAPDPGSCSADDGLCLSTRAREAAAAGRVSAAAAACVSVDDDRARQDCFFAAAEAVPPGPDQYADAVRLCLGAGSFASMCHGHVLIAVLSRPGPFALPPLVEQAARVRDAWTDAWANPEVGQRAVERLWSLAVAGRADTIPDPLTLAEGAPPEAAQQLRNLHAERRWAVDRARDGGLWRDYYPGEQGIPAVFLLDLGTGARPADDDPARDLALAELEAAARVEDGQDALVEALAGDDALLRWSAARLLAQVAPEHPALVAARADPDPRVAQRASPLPPPGLAEP